MTIDVCLQHNECSLESVAIADDVLNNELVTITTKNGNLIVMSEEDWEGVLETLYPMSDP